MNRLRSLASFALILLASQAPAQVEPRSEDEPASVAFKIVAANADAAAPGTQTFVATYGSGDSQATFVIELDGKRRKAAADPAAGLDISFATGRFRHVGGSKPGAFLTAIATALQAKSPKLSQVKADVLPFEIAILGDHESRTPQGGFSNHPAGDWVPTKIFVADGNGEVFFNFNSVSGEAEFSIKDEDYGDVVVEEFSKVLW